MEEQLSDEGVGALAKLAGVAIEVERVPAVAETYRTLRARALELEAIDLEGVEPAMRFDARWAEDEA